jgi:hypothetical protein
VELTTGVPPNTSLADLDEALRTLLRRELDRVGFAGVAIAFEAPNREWAATVTQPTLNLYLYDLRENQQRRRTQWERGESDGRRTETRPPLWLDASYTLTAWARAVEDEHRLLSQALTALHSYPEIPVDVLPSALADQLEQLGPLRTRVGDPQSDATADFWMAVGGPYRLSFHYIVTVPFSSGAVLHRGPPVRSQQVRVGRRVAARSTVEESSSTA